MEIPKHSLTICVLLLCIAATACNGRQKANDPQNHEPAATLAKSDSTTAKDGGGIRVSLQLKDGSRLFGYPLADSISIQTQYATLNLSFRLVRTIEFEQPGGHATAFLTSGERLQGSLQPQVLTLRCLVGTVPVDFKDVLLLTVIVPAPSLDSALVAFYPFDGNPEDKSGQGHHGTVRGARLSTDRFGAPNKAYAFTDDETYISIPDGIIRYDMPEFSISVWLLAEDLNRDRIALYWGAATGEAILETRNRQMSFCVDILGTWHIVGTPVNVNNWTHVAAVYRRGQTIEIWTNGEKKNQVPIPNADLVHGMSTHNSSIGSYAPEHFNHTRAQNLGSWLGSLDQIRVYSRALRPEEIGALYTSDR